MEAAAAVDRAGSDAAVPRLVAGGGTGPVQRDGAERAEGGGEVAARGGFQLVFHVQWHLLFKLAFVVFLLSQNSSLPRVCALGSIALLIYFWQENPFQFARQRVAGFLPGVANRLRNGMSFQGGENQRAPDTWLGYYTIIVFVFFYSFICSLVPSWTPIRLLPPPPGTTNDQADGANPRPNEAHPHID